MNVRLSKKAQKYYERAPKNLQEIFDESLEDLQLGKGNIERLKGTKNRFRLKIYHYRMIFEIDIESNEIHVVEIGTRGDIY